LSAIEYELIDGYSNQATKSQFIRPAPLTLLGPYHFTFATPGLTTGVALVTLPVGAVIYDVGVEVVTAFDGTTPKADVGTFSSTHGLFDELAAAAVIDLSSADAAVTSNTGLSSATTASWLSTAIGSAGAAGGAAYLPALLYVTAVSTLSLVVSQDGSQGGTAIGGAAGVGNVFVLCATPIVS
jgi:hypothetical protein